MTTPRKGTNTYPALTMRVLNAVRRLINRNPSKFGLAWPGLCVAQFPILCGAPLISGAARGVKTC